MGVRITPTRYALGNGPVAADQLWDCCWGARPHAHRNHEWRRAGRMLARLLALSNAPVAAPSAIVTLNLKVLKSTVMGSTLTTATYTPVDRA
jgi:hypothetical protein